MFEMAGGNLYLLCSSDGLLGVFDKLPLTFVLLRMHGVAHAVSCGLLCIFTEFCFFKHVSFLNVVLVVKLPNIMFFTIVFII